jgi:hypothetical protein
MDTDNILLSEVIAVLVYFYNKRNNKFTIGL